MLLRQSPPCAGDVPQNAVDKAGGSLLTPEVRQTDRFVDGRRGGNLVHKKELVGPQAQQLQHLGRKLLQRRFGVGRQYKIEG